MEDRIARLEARIVVLEAQLARERRVTARAWRAAAVLALKVILAGFLAYYGSRE